VKPRKRPSTSGGGRPAAIGGRRWAWGLAVAVLALVTWLVLRLWSVTAPSGARLGRLPSGVRPSDLNVLLVTLDTTRADRLGAYGFTAIETPHLDRIAREGVLFEHAVAPAPLTLPAHSSLFTSKLPPAHGVRDNGGFFLDDRETTMAERLKSRGFRTGGFVGAYVLDHKWGVAQGFEKYFDNFDLSKYRSVSLSSVERRGNEVADRALEWLDKVGSSRFFAWVHFYDAHSPYDPPEPYKSRYSDRPYAGEIAFVDSQVGRLLAWLDAHQQLDKTVVVVIGDHGESLGDHGEGTHGFFVYESVLHVPLLIRAPYNTMSGRRVSDVVRNVDVLPTVLDLLGIPSSDTFEGQSLVSLMTGARSGLGLEAYAEAVYPRFHFGWSDLRTLRAGRYKYIEAPRPELYDLEKDPKESTNIYPQRRALGGQMRARLHRLEQRLSATASSARAPAEIDPDTRDRLASLGYVGTFVSGGSSAPSELADPKDKIELFNLITHARDLSRHDKNSDEAIKSLLEVTRQDPKVIDAWFMLGNEYYRKRQFTQAIESYKQALALKSDYDLVVINMANAYRQLGKDEEALVGYRRFMELDPRNAQIRYEAAQILVDRGELAEARAQLDEALKLQPSMAAARNALGIIALKNGDAAQAEREIRSAIDLKADVRLAHFNLALLAEQRGDLGAAVDEYKREIELYPTSYKAEFNLGRLYEQIGDVPAQLEAYKKAIDINPNFAEGHFFLAKLYLDLNQTLDEAVRLARKGLELGPSSEYAPLGHYVIADVYAREGRIAESARQAALGRALEARIKQRTAGGSAMR
jgi:arylsulfatase A-like enzyme/Tfp pilus assembly protein PilF